MRSLLEHVVRRLGHEPVAAEPVGGCPEDVDAAVIEPGDAFGIVCARRLGELARPFLFASIFPAGSEVLELRPAAYFVKPFPLAEIQLELAAALQ